MYAYVEGYLTEKSPAYVVIDCHGVGYHLNISLNTYSRLPNPHEEPPQKCRLLTHLLVRDDAHILYGFIDEAERELFRELITVSGIGANTARLILSSSSVADIKTAIQRGNVPLLQSIKGIGAKTAQRIIVDLKDKVGLIAVATDNLGAAYNTQKEEALSALVMLGFNKSAAEKALQKIIASGGDAMSVEVLVKNALKML